MGNNLQSDYQQSWGHRHLPTAQLYLWCTDQKNHWLPQHQFSCVDQGNVLYWKWGQYIRLPDLWARGIKSQLPIMQQSYLRPCDQVLLQMVGILTYCKHGYFRWGKISWKCWQDFPCGDNFHDNTPTSLIKPCWYYFRAGEIFGKKAMSQKLRKLPPRENSTFTIKFN